jgi:putative spermidine/putrescine transport system ATP-binding protein
VLARGDEATLRDETKMPSSLANQPSVDRSGQTPLGLELLSVRKAFGERSGVVAVHDVSLGVQRGEFFTLLGPSGSGKTTSLNLVAGFLAPDRGDIRISGQSVTRLPPERREIGVVFQSYALFPHMTIGENVAFPLRRRRVRGAEVKDRVRNVLELVGLEERANSRPAQLSGGQQQRAALARALVMQPRLVLLDEPLGALDRRLRQYLQEQLRQLHQSVGFTALYVTHDQEEALALSDRIGIMSDGRLIQVGTGEQIYKEPASLFVARFLGDANTARATVVARHGASMFDVKMEDSGVVLEAGSAQPLTLGERVEVVARPEHLEIQGHEHGGEPVLGAGILRERVFLGSDVLSIVETADGEIKVRERPVGDRQEGSVGSRVIVRWHRGVVPIAVRADATDASLEEEIEELD